MFGMDGGMQREYQKKRNGRNTRREEAAMKTGRRAGFTLIEILVVVVIVGVLFALGVMVFENAGKKDPVRGANLVINTMRLARQQAVAKRQWTLVVFPTRDGGAYADRDLPKCLRGFAVLAVVNDMESLDRMLQTPDHMEFEFAADWKYLPEGLTFDDDPTRAENYVFGAPSGGGPTYTGAFRFPLDPANPGNHDRPMGAVLFKPNGRAYVMHDVSPTGHYWQDVDGSKLYVTAAKHYEAVGGLLGAPTTVPGATSIVGIRNKTGQAELVQ